ncbi:hypothetical protein FAZ97_17330 [Paraburkholderia acidiphila]|uniref:N4 Gp49/Sf6 Gp66 family protein n=2 Tax=Paraburkholderia acidiphila TaxID=2571747 RepID=A0A7Z2G7N2_9BURK|nr:hypothetical protein FAZ97_17330 [Paraburkholderia acidiphila]
MTITEKRMEGANLEPQPYVSLADVQREIRSVHYFTAYDGVRGSTPPGLRSYVPRQALKAVTFCVLELRNGFIVTGESVCARDDAFDDEKGRAHALERAMEKLTGYVIYAWKSAQS